MNRQPQLARRAQKSRSAHSTKVRRKDKGMTGNGGQFAATKRAESKVKVEIAPKGAPSEVQDVVSARLQSEGVHGESELAREISTAWSRRFYPDGLTAHSREDQAILHGDLPPWRALATRDDVEKANESSVAYIRARQSGEAEIQGARQVFEATDQMLVELGAEDSRRRREAVGMVLSQAAIMVIPRKYRGYAQGAFSTYLIAKSVIGPRREYSETNIELATSQIVHQQEMVRQQIHPSIERMNARRAEAEEAQWKAGLGDHERRMRYQGQEVPYLDALTGKPRVETEDVDSELDVEIV